MKTKKNVKRDDTISAFGRMDFEKLENIFNVQLFGLNEQETENELDNLRQEWLKYSREERQEIIDNYDFDGND
jgi:hypothetical protein